jgi:hypothetical protein
MEIGDGSREKRFEEIKGVCSAIIELHFHFNSVAAKKDPRIMTEFE